MGFTRDPDGLFKSRRTGIAEIDSRIEQNEARESGRSSSSPESAPSAPAQDAAPVQAEPAEATPAAGPDTLTGRA